MTSPGSSETPDRTDAGAAELRRRLARLVARHGAALADDEAGTRACEAELAPLYRGPTAVRAYAVVQALKGGLVAELLRRPDASPALVARLGEQCGASPAIAAWALDAWRGAYADLLAAERARAAEVAARATPAPRDAPHPRPASAPAREVVLRLPHLLLLGVAAAAVFVALVAAGGRLPAPLRVFGEAAASAPAMPPAPPPEPGTPR